MGVFFGTGGFGGAFSGMDSNFLLGPVDFLKLPFTFGIGPFATAQIWQVHFCSDLVDGVIIM